MRLKHNGSDVNSGRTIDFDFCFLKISGFVGDGEQRKLINLIFLTILFVFIVLCFPQGGTTAPRESSISM